MTSRSMLYMALLYRRVVFLRGILCCGFGIHGRGRWVVVVVTFGPDHSVHLRCAVCTVFIPFAVYSRGDKRDEKKEQPSTLKLGFSCMSWWHSCVHPLRPQCSIMPTSSGDTRHRNNPHPTRASLEPFGKLSWFFRSTRLYRPHST